MDGYVISCVYIVARKLSPSAHTHTHTHARTHAHTRETQPHVPRHKQVHTTNKQTRDISRGVAEYHLFFNFLTFSFLYFERSKNNYFYAIIKELI
jgi:hypothetical protein